MMRRLLLALLLAFAPAAAWAQSARDFPTPNLGERVPLMLQGCLNAQAQAVPFGAACASTLPVSGTVTSNQGAPNAGGPQAWWVQWSGMSVAVSNFPATQAVSNAGTFAVQNTAPVVGGNSVAVKTDGSATTQPVSATALPLPANAAKETGGNLDTLIARTPTLGPKTAAGSQPVTLPTDQGAIPTADPNNAAYSAFGPTFAIGATVAAGRALYLNCTASGSVTMTGSGGGSIAYPVTAGANVLPFAVTQVSADTASCTHQTIN